MSHFSSVLLTLRPFLSVVLFVEPFFVSFKVISSINASMLALSSSSLVSLINSELCDGYGSPVLYLTSLFDMHQPELPIMFNCTSRHVLNGTVQNLLSFTRNRKCQTLRNRHRPIIASERVFSRSYCTKWWNSNDWFQSTKVSLDETRRSKRTTTKTILSHADKIIENKLN